MVIEFTHRAMTSVDTVLAIALCAWAFLVFPRKHAVRRYAVLSLVFLFVEALLGAGLVLLRYVARDQSAGRAWYLSAHLTNTLLLLSALTITACVARKSLDAMSYRRVPPALLGALGVAVIVSITGAIAALGDTLFPASSLSAGMQQDFSSASSALLRLRMFHPLLAVIGAAYIAWTAFGTLKRNRTEAIRWPAKSVLALVVGQLAVGAVNLSFLAPVWMQLLHLFVADLLWISLVILAVQSATIPEAVAYANRSCEEATPRV